MPRSLGRSLVLALTTGFTLWVTIRKVISVCKRVTYVSDLGGGAEKDLSSKLFTNSEPWCEAGIFLARVPHCPGASWTEYTPSYFPSTRMYVAGIMDHFTNAPKVELIVWGSTMGIVALSTFGFRSQYKLARSKAGDTKPGSTGPRILTATVLSGQFFTSVLPPFVYLGGIASNKFRQPEWMTRYALPPPPGVFGIDGVTAGRAVGLLAVLTGAVLAQTALKALGDQYNPIGVSTPFFRGLPSVDRQLIPCLGYR